MSGKTYKMRAIVLKKTRLAERDVIVTMVDEAGSLVKGVAKGARKPGGALAAKIELFSTIDALVAEGRTLDTLCEVRLAVGDRVRSFGLEQATCASPIAELVCTVAQQGLPQPRLFDMTNSALAHIAAATAPDAVALCAAALWKIMAQVGFRPCLNSCAVCGAPVELPESTPTAYLSLSDGGVLCDRCRRTPGILALDAHTLRWCALFLAETFDGIVGAHVPTGASLAALQLAGQWVHAHTGRDLKSIGFLFASGLF